MKVTWQIVQLNICLGWQMLTQRKSERKKKPTQKSSVSIHSPNLLTDAAQSLLMVVTEPPGVIWSPMAQSKLRAHWRKEGKSHGNPERQLWDLCINTCSPPKFPTAWGLHLQSLPLNFPIEVNLSKGWVRMRFKPVATGKVWCKKWGQTACFVLLGEKMQSSHN